MDTKRRKGVSIISNIHFEYEYTVPMNETKIVNLTGKDINIYADVDDTTKLIYCFPKVNEVIRLIEKERKDVEYLIPNNDNVEIPIWSSHVFDIASDVPKKYYGYDIILCYSVAKIFVHKYPCFNQRVLYPDMDSDSVIKKGKCGSDILGIRRLAIMNRVPLCSTSSS